MGNLKNMILLLDVGEDDEEGSGSWCF
jgi:hypothetical protein